MKKVLSVVLALVMMFAVCVPAFAAELKGNQTNDAANPVTDNTVIVKTQTTDDSGNPITPEEFANFTVVLPADFVMTWDDDSVVAETYTAEAHLTYGKHLNITVAGNGAMKLDVDASKTLPYALSGDTAFVATAESFAPTTLTLNAKVEMNDWKTAIVGYYEDTLTFTAWVA